MIDDDEAMRALITQILAIDGHQVIAVPSAEDGLEQLPYFTFQVAFIDQNLPGMEGLVLGEYLRRNNPHMKVALVTGETDRRLERVAGEKSITFIAKPFDVAAIRDVVDAFKHTAGARRQDRLERQDEHFDPPISEHHDDLAAYYEIPSVPSRVADRLIFKLRSSLSHLRSTSRYNERDRVAALTGLMTAQVMGVDLPRWSDGRTFFEVYDDAMAHHGRRTEFTDS